MTIRHLVAGTLLLALTATVNAQDGQAWANAHTLVVTASNTSANQLLVYSASGALLREIPTQGQGGVSGNAGGIEQNRDRLAVVNFGSGNVSVFTKGADRAELRFESLVRATGSPVSVAFGNDHLYILTTTHVESHAIGRDGVSPNADGTSSLLIADGSAAQVGVVTGQLVISEKSNAIETVKLRIPR
jgi:hypothetical protein